MVSGVGAGNGIRYERLTRRGPSASMVRRPLRDMVKLGKLPPSVLLSTHNISPEQERRLIAAALAGGKNAPARAQTR